MALSGTLTGSYHSLGNYRIKLNWSATQDIANNRSTVTAKVYLDADWNLSYSARKYGKTTVNGSSKSWSSDDNHSGTGEWLIASHMFTVNHNSDGTKSFSLSAYFDLNITIGNGYIGRLYVSGSAKLNTIPRKSTISSLGNFTIGGHPSISFSVAYSGFKHDIVAKVNNKDMQRWDNLSSLPTSLAFNSTADNRMYSELCNSTSGTMRVYLNTRNSSGDLIGQDYKDVTISVSSSIIPSIDSVSISEAVSGLATQFGGYVQNKSKLSIAMSASGNKYSTIRSYKITANGRSYSSSSATTEILKSSGSNRITFEVTDSRGRKMSTHRDITVIAYDNPQIYDLSAERSNSAGILDDQGNYARVNYHAAISSVNSNNTKSFKVSYRLSGAATWTDVSLPNTNYSYDTYKVIGPLDVDYSYDIQLVVSDYFTDVPADTSVSSTFTLINFARDKKGLAFGKTYDESIGGRMQISGDAYLSGDILLDYPSREDEFKGLDIIDRNGKIYGQFGFRNFYDAAVSPNGYVYIGEAYNGANAFRFMPGEDVPRIGWDKLFEIGENANGKWVKYVDGTLICMFNFGINRYNTNSLLETWIYPRSFTSTPTVNFTINAGYIKNVVVAEIATTYLTNISSGSATLGVRTETTGLPTDAHLGVQAIAIGRWK